MTSTRRRHTKMHSTKWEKTKNDRRSNLPLSRERSASNKRVWRPSSSSTLPDKRRKKSDSRRSKDVIKMRKASTVHTHNIQQQHDDDNGDIGTRWQIIKAKKTEKPGQRFRRSSRSDCCCQSLRFISQLSSKSSASLWMDNFIYSFILRISLSLSRSSFFPPSSLMPLIKPKYILRMFFAPVLSL